MYVLANFSDHRFYRNGDINFYTNSHMDTLEKAKLTTSTRHIALFLKSGTPIYNSKVPDTASKKNEKKKNTGNCKALCVSHKRKKHRGT